MPLTTTPAPAPHAPAPQPEHPSANPPTWLRVEDERLLTGQGCFAGDLRLPGMLHAVFVRSPYARARVRGVDAAAARALPQVRAVLCAEDFAGLVQPQVNTTLSPMVLPQEALMPLKRVDAVGAPVALVLAHTRAAAQAAAELVLVDYEELPHVADFGGEGTVHANVPAGCVADLASRSGTLPATSPSARAAVSLPRVAPAPLEPGATVVQWDAGSASLCAWLSTQTPSRARQDIALALGLPPERVRVIAPDVGGAFGGKASVRPEDLLLASAAQRLQATIRWQATRSEDLLAAPHGRASALQGRLWLDAQGRMQALAAELRFSLGHWLTYSAVVPARNALRILPGPYRIDHFDITSRATLSNAAAVGIYRGAGRPEAAILLERLVDQAAAQAGIDPLELRLRNVWQRDELPRDLPHGQRLDSADLPALLQCAAAVFDYAGRRTAQAAARARGEVLGLGIALYVEPCGQGGESVRLTALADGTFELATGATAQGQGRETAYAQIAAEALGCTSAQVRVLHGDTARCPEGIGALASRSTAIGGSAIVHAARELKAQLAQGATLPCTVSQFHTVAHEAWASGCVMVQMAIDRDTGEPRIDALAWVDDAGNVVNPTLVKGQLLGGLAQGIGQAMMERLVYDDNGQLITGSLMDYALPRAIDMPRHIALESLSTPSAANTLGAKGVGEAGCIGVPAALLNAAHDALRPFGAQDLPFPLTAERLWRAMQTQP
jgi:aerobic carbon-monoxide dehydrogenase large subunit